MKIVSYKNEKAHNKNKIAFKQMCEDMGFEYLECNDISHIPSNTDLIWSSMTTISPDSVPSQTKILFGPGFFVFPNPANSIFYFEYRGKAVYTCLSGWVKTLFSEFIQGPRIDFTPCPFPVDIKKFCPDENPNKNNDILLYFKHRNPELKNKAIIIFEYLGLSYKLFEYGEYKEDNYIEALQRTKLTVWIGPCESQGFALQECLSINVPILILDAESMFDECDQKTGRMYYANEVGKYNLRGTSAPWWDERCGIKTENIDDMAELIPQMLNSLDSYKPREYVLENLSSSVCWNRLKVALWPQ